MRVDSRRRFHGYCQQEPDKYRRLDENYRGRRVKGFCEINSNKGKLARLTDCSSSLGILASKVAVEYQHPFHVLFQVPSITARIEPARSHRLVQEKMCPQHLNRFRYVGRLSLRIIFGREMLILQHVRCNIFIISATNVQVFLPLNKMRLWLCCSPPRFLLRCCLCLLVRLPLFELFDGRSKRYNNPRISFEMLFHHRDFSLQPCILIGLLCR